MNWKNIVTVYLKELKESDFQAATQRIYRSQRFPSSVAISVVPAGAAR